MQGNEAKRRENREKSKGTQGRMRANTGTERGKQRQTQEKSEENKGE